MIHPFDFSRFPLDQKADYVWENGVFVHCKRIKSEYVSLYHLGAFYAQLYYDPMAGQVLNVVLRESNSPMDTTSTGPAGC